MTALAETVENGQVLDIPLNKLKKSPRNARQVPHTEADIKSRAASIAAKGIIQPLVVEPETDAKGAPTGFFLVTIGEGRRLAQCLRAKRKEIKSTEPVRCIVDTANDPFEVSLDENISRTDMHPADQFEAFRDLAERNGWGAEAIGARFGVTAAVVRQRLRLAAVSPQLMLAYRAGEMTLDQLMAFTITEDHARQEAVWEGLPWKDPSAIRRALAEGKVRASDRRAIFVGAEAYVLAGGMIERDLFTEDNGGYFTDPGLLDRLVLERLTDTAEAIQAVGWKWASACLEFPHVNGLRRIYPKIQPRSEADQARLNELEQQYEALADEYEADEELPENVVEQLDAIAKELEVLQEKLTAYDPEDIARSGVIVVLDHLGRPRIEMGFVRPEDDKPAEPAHDDRSHDEEGQGAPAAVPDTRTGSDTLAPLSDRLIADLTAHRTAALRDRLAGDPEVALWALVHSLALQTFYPGYSLNSCLDCKVTSAGLSGYAQGITDTLACRNIDERCASWAGRLPEDASDLWTFIGELSQSDRLALLAHCVSHGINAVRAWENRSRALAHADQLAATLGLDMTAYWRPTASSYFGQVTKAHILDAVREAVSEDAARRIEGAKKPVMAEAAEGLVADTAWLPALLRTPSDERAVEAPLAAE